MRLKRVIIKNWMGLPDLEFRPGAVTVLSGKNGSAKTSALEVLHAFDNRVHDPARIRAGSEVAEASVEMDNGHLYRMRVTAKSTTWDFTDEKGRKITKSAEHIRSIINSVSMDPVKFAEAKGREQVEMYVRACPMALTVQDLAFIPPEALRGVDLNGHALAVIGDDRRGMYGTFYQTRTDANRIVREKQAAVKQLSEGLPAEAEGGDWKAIFEAADLQYRMAQDERTATINAIGDEARAAREKQIVLFTTSKDQIRAELSKEIERLKVEAMKKVVALETARDREIVGIDGSRDSALLAIEMEYRPKIQALGEKVANAKASIDSQAKDEATRNFIAGEQLKIESAQSKADGAEVIMHQLDALRTRLSGESPIPGIEVTPDELLLNGVPMRLVNQAERIRIALEVSKLAPSECGLIVIDNAEHLDTENWERFQVMAKEAAEKSGLQFVVARVTDQPELTITSDGTKQEIAMDETVKDLIENPPAKPKLRAIRKSAPKEPISQSEGNDYANTEIYDRR